MKTSPSSVGIEPIPSSRFAFLVGALLLVEGIWGLFSNVVFAVLTTNRLHAVIHIVLGLVGIITSRRTGSHGFSLFLGALLIAVGILRFVPIAGDWVVQLLNVNPTVAVVNIVIGVIALIVASRDRAVDRNW